MTICLINVVEEAVIIYIIIFNFIRRDQNDSSKTIIRKKTT